ncbi:MAG: AMP-binding protein, partial [Pseudomonadales bacterium]|nr:AMP-binding protein [Pseudomonadales bacterium]
MFGDAIHSLYGQSETGAVTLCPAREWLRTDMEGSNPIRSVGKVHPLCLVKIVDPDTHEEKAFGEEGEICVKIDTRMPGYWRNEKATQETIFNGWVHTGDVGYLDKNGYLYMCDRKDDMILSGGFNIWPAELENAISKLDSVQEVVVIGIPNERFGESPHAIVMEKVKGSVTKEEIIQAVVEECGSYKKPGSVEISTNPIKRTPVGKLSRKLIREPYWEGTGRRK